MGLASLFALDAAVRAAAPVVSVRGSPGSVSVAFDAAATQAQKDAANAIVAGWDWSDAAESARKDASEPDLANLRDQAQNALDGNTTYLAIASPTNAQVVAQVQALTQQTQKIIKALKLLAIAALN